MIGLGKETDEIRQLSIAWPSGVTTNTNGLPVNKLVTAFEEATDSDSGSGFDVSAYEPVDVSIAASGGQKKQRFKLPSAKDQNSQLYLYTSMATWCAACSEQIPQLATIRSHFSPDELAMFALAADPIESRAKLDAYVTSKQPAYELVRPNSAELEQFMRISRKLSFSDAIPTTIVTDSDGNVLQAFAGVPNVSDLAQLSAH